VYTRDEWSAGGSRVNLNKDEMKTFLKEIIMAVKDIYGFEPEFDVNYRMHQSLLELYFNDVQKQWMLTVKFEPGCYRFG